jgi:hypothetical protein
LIDAFDVYVHFATAAGLRNATGRRRLSLGGSWSIMTPSTVCARGFQGVAFAAKRSSPAN